MTHDASHPVVGRAILPIRTDAQGCIDEDVPCRRCGYNLRSLVLDGRCPECGTAVGRSLHGDLLRFSDPAWVQSLASGMNWILAGMIIGFIVGAVAGGLVRQPGPAGDSPFACYLWPVIDWLRRLLESDCTRSRGDRITGWLLRTEAPAGRLVRGPCACTDQYRSFPIRPDRAGLVLRRRESPRNRRNVCDIHVRSPACLETAR